MRLALISDIHGNLPALEAIHDDLRARGVDRVVNLGDSLSGPLWPRETAQYLMAEGWLSLAGNHERQVLSLPIDRMGGSDAYTRSQLKEPELEWMRGLPGTCRLDEDVLLCHGTPDSDLQYFLDTPVAGGTRLASSREIQERLRGERASLVACGHTHIARVVCGVPGQWLLNPGSAGLPAYADDHPVDHVVETGSPDARYAIADRRGMAWQVTLLSVPYDHEAAASLAQSRGRMEWATALRTGFVSL